MIRLMSKIILLTNVVKCCYIHLFSLQKHLKKKQDFKIRVRISPERENFDHSTLFFNRIYQRLFDLLLNSCQTFRVNNK